MEICNVNQTELSWPICPSIDPAQERQKKPFFVRVHFWNLKCRKMRKGSGCCSRATLVAPFIWMIGWKKKDLLNVGAGKLEPGETLEAMRAWRPGGSGFERENDWVMMLFLLWIPAIHRPTTVPLSKQCLVLSTWSRAALKWLFYDFEPEFAPSKCSNCTQVKKQLYQNWISAGRCDLSFLFENYNRRNC